MRAVRVAVTLALLTALLVALGETGAQAAPAAPTRGQCFAYTHAQWKSGTTARGGTPVKCGGRHTAVAYSVGRLTGAGARGSAPGSAAVQQATRGCNRALVSSIGRRVLLTRAYPSPIVWFPSAPAWKSGARWYRCDAVLPDGASRFAYLPANYLTQLGGATTYGRYRLCLTRTLGDTACSSTHSWKAVGYALLGADSAPWPGTSRIASLAKAACRRTLPHATKLQLRYPTSGSWSLGRRYVRCFVPG